MTFNHVGMEIGFLSNIFHIFILRFSKSIMLNTNLDEKIDIVKGDLEEFLVQSLVMKLHWDIINKDFNEKVDIVEEDLEEILPKSDFVPNLLQVCQLL